MSDERMNSDPEKYGTPDYPDPIAPVAYPGATGPANMAGAPGSMHEQYPGYTGPSPYPPAPITASNGPGGMAIAALIVGIAAFVLGWVPFAGLLEPRHEEVTVVVEPVVVGAQHPPHPLVLVTVESVADLADRLVIRRFPAGGDDLPLLRAACVERRVEIDQREGCRRQGARDIEVVSLDDLDGAGP